MMYDPYIMKRTQIYLEDDQDVRLAKRAAATGVTKSRLIRQAIEAYLEAPRNDAERMARFRRALDEVEASPARLPDGASYVEGLRLLDVQRQAELERRRA